MAVVGPALVSDTTNTDGTGSLSLNNASSDGRRGLADAVSNGDAANSDTVHYLILDSGTSGNSLDFEKGEGTISDSGATLSRDTVHQSSNTGNKVSWPAGGTRDVLIAVGIEDLLVAANNLSDLDSASTARTNLDVPGLSEANTYSGTQTIDRSGTQPIFQLRTDLDTGVLARFLGIGHDSGGNDTIYSDIRTIAGGNTDGAEEGQLRFMVMDAGTLTEHFRITSSGVEDGSGNKFDAFPSGTKVLFANAPPTGWTRVNETDSRVIRLATSGDTVGSTGGADGIFSGSWTTVEHTLKKSEIPSHTHPISDTADANADDFVLSSEDGGSAGDLNNQGTGTRAFYAETITGAAGGDGSHSHDMSTPLYTIACWATKD